MFENGKMWADDVGKPIQAHGGCIIQHDGMWYWYGEHKGAKNCPGTTRVDVIGISCYSSKDMNSWRYEGLALDVKDSPKGRKTSASVRRSYIIKKPENLSCGCIWTLRIILMRE